MSSLQMTFLCAFELWTYYHFISLSMRLDVHVLRRDRMSTRAVTRLSQASSFNDRPMTSIIEMPGEPSFPLSFCESCQQSSF